jgi:hypothetical protein
MSPQVEVKVDVPEGAKCIAVMDYDKFKAAVEHLKVVHPEAYTDLVDNFQFNLNTYEVLEETN